MTSGIVGEVQKFVEIYVTSFMKQVPTSVSGTGLQQTKPLEVSCSSGYMGDNSSARTPGIFLREKLAEENTEERIEKSYAEKNAEKKESVEPKEKKTFPKYNFANRRQVKSCRSLILGNPVIRVLPILG